MLMFSYKTNNGMRQVELMGSDKWVQMGGLRGHPPRLDRVHALARSRVPYANRLVTRGRT